MKTQTLYKRLSMPLLLTVISATGIGVSSPARSASLLGSQSTIIDAKPEATLIAQRIKCPANPPPSHPCFQPRAPLPSELGAQPGKNPTRDEREQQRIKCPVNPPPSHPCFQPRAPLPSELGAQPGNNPVRYELEQQQRELQQQQRELQQQQRELQQQQRELQQQSHQPRISQRSLA